jgi:hypothetical protein
LGEDWEARSSVVRRLFSGRGRKVGSPAVVIRTTNPDEPVERANEQE